MNQIDNIMALHQEATDAAVDYVVRQMEPWHQQAVVDDSKRYMERAQQAFRTAIEQAINTCGPGAGCLHKAARIETLEQELATIKESLTVQEPVAYTFTRCRLDGYKTRHFLWADDYKDSPRDLKFVLDGQDDVVILYTTPNPQPKPLFAENEALRQTMAEALRWCPGGCHAQYLLKTALARAGEKE